MPSGQKKPFQNSREGNVERKIGFQPVQNVKIESNGAERNYYPHELRINPEEKRPKQPKIEQESESEE